MTKGKKPPRKAEPQPENPKCDVCTHFSSKGPNAYINKRTCIKCGHWTKTRVEEKEYKHDERHCKHENFNCLGSTKEMKVFNCLDCGAKTRLSRKDYEAVKGAQATIVRMSVTSRDVVNQASKEAILPVADATKTIKLFKETATRFIETSKSDIAVNDLVNITRCSRCSTI